MVQIIVAALGLAVAALTTRQCARYQLMGMPAGMAAMMAAMGTGLSVGYAAGMSLDLGTATLIGVVAGVVHGLWMGRRYGPVAALDGAGGGAMGGLMGPMLSVMLLYLPDSLLLTAALMLGMQVLFSVGAVYLIAAAAGGAASSAWMRAAGRLFGAESVPLSSPYDRRLALGLSLEASTDALAPGEAALSRSARAAQADGRPASAGHPAPPIPAGRGKRAAKRARKQARGGIHFDAKALAVATGILAIVAIKVVPDLASSLSASPSAAAGSATSRGSGRGPEPTPVLAVLSDDDVQEVAMTLRRPDYEPRLIQVERGIPLRITVAAPNDPG